MLQLKLPENIQLNTKGNPLDHDANWKEVEINGEKLIRETDFGYVCVFILVLFNILFSEKAMVLIKKSEILDAS